MISKHFLAAWLVTLGFVSSGLAQEWATKMFDRTKHDFGTVARGAKVECIFTVTNQYVEDIHIAGVRSSCGCTTPEIEKQTLKSREQGRIIAHFNTRQFLGAKDATVTVVIDQPYAAEVQLHVHGYIRSDVVLDPGVVDFGTMDVGKAGEKKLSVTYAGRETWQIVDVLSANQNLEAELHETGRGNGMVSYELLVRLKPDAPAGYIRDQLTLVTNDQRSRHIPVDVEGRIKSEVSVSPASLFLGVRRPGETVTKRLVVQGKRAFRIVSVKCEDGCFKFEVPEESRRLHLIPVTFVAGDKPGKVVERIEIEIDQSGEPLELTAYADVLKPEG